MFWPHPGRESVLTRVDNPVGRAAIDAYFAAKDAKYAREESVALGVGVSDSDGEAAAGSDDHSCDVGSGLDDSDGDDDLMEDVDDGSDCDLDSHAGGLP